MARLVERAKPEEKATFVRTVSTDCWWYSIGSVVESSVVDCWRVLDFVPRMIVSPRTVEDSREESST